MKTYESSENICNDAKAILDSMSGRTEASILIQLAGELDTDHVITAKVVAMVAVLMEGLDGISGITPEQLASMALDVKNRIHGVNTKSI